jgi:hypothetical protein
VTVTGIAPDGRQHYFTADNAAGAIVLCDALRAAGWTAVTPL